MADPDIVALLGASGAFCYLWLAGNEGMDDANMETAIMGYKGTTVGIQSFIPS